MTRMDRRALFASGAAAALLAASGVSASPRRGGRLRVALSGAARDDTWDRVGGRFMQAAASALFEGLTEIAADGTLRGEMATDWHSDDGRVWHFTLRETVFHDDLPLTDADLACSLAALGTVTHTRGQMTLTLDKSDQNLPYHLAGPDYLIKPADTARRAQGIGSGLYALRKFDAGRHVIADRVQSHWKDGQAGWVDEVELVHFADSAVRAQALAEGLVDVADIDSLSPEMDPRAFTRLPDDARSTQVVATRVSVPLQIGRAFPLDNLRMAERWWLA